MIMDMIVILLTIQHLKIVIVFLYFFFYFQVEMPVFFYLDPDLLNDPRMDNVDDIVLSYTFFSSKDQEVKYPGQQTNMPANA